MILAILIDQLQSGKVASVSRNIVHLFVSKLPLPKAQQYLVPLTEIDTSTLFFSITTLHVDISYRDTVFIISKVL